MKTNAAQLDLSIVIPALNEAENLSLLLPQVLSILTSLSLSFEIIVVDEKPDESTITVVNRYEVTLLSPQTHGYGSALLEGLRYAHSDYVVTMDADLSHPPKFLETMWGKRQIADIIIASRYISGGRSIMPTTRYLLSRVLNIFFSRGLSLRVKDMSSGFRLYRRKVLKLNFTECKDFDILQELLVRSLVEGYTVQEIPFTYQPRKYGSSQARVFKFGLAYLRTFKRLWKLRNSIASADYDARAYDSWIVIQRYWQRQRYRHIGKLIGAGSKCIDVGCGSSRILERLHNGSVALDIQINKLRFAKRFPPIKIQGSALIIPFRDGSFSTVICSQVIEHIAGKEVLNELDRILEPGGLLVLGTPDYNKWQWRLTEYFYKKLLPNAYADEYITHYTCLELIGEFVKKRNYMFIDRRYILHGELILAFRKPLILN